jgi:hypothetical protein
MKTMSTTRVNAAPQTPNQVAPVRVRGTGLAGDIEERSLPTDGLVVVAASTSALGVRCVTGMTSPLLRRRGWHLKVGCRRFPDNFIVRLFGLVRRRPPNWHERP